MNIYRGFAPFFRRKSDWDMRLFVPATEQDTWKYPIHSWDDGVWYMGYSNVGRVIETGSDVKNIKVGDIVHSDAAHQSQVIRKENQVMKLPDSVKPENGIFFTNLCTAFNGILDSRIKLGDKVAISGLGVIGQLLVQLVKLSGASKVYGIDRIQKRLDIAMENGADVLFNSDDAKDIAYEIRKLTANVGPDLVFEASGNVKALNEAIRIAAPETTITAMGWYQGECTNLNLSEEFHHNRVTVKSSQTSWINPEIRHMWNHDRKKQTCAELLSTMQLGNLITHMIPYDQIADAYEIIDKDPRDVIQIVIQYE
jgi:threonine dehydrogenase-like Zn-dependent dehydrogenase